MSKGLKELGPWKLVVCNGPCMHTQHQDLAQYTKIVHRYTQFGCHLHDSLNSGIDQWPIYMPVTPGSMTSFRNPMLSKCWHHVVDWVSKVNQYFSSSWNSWSFPFWVRCIDGLSNWMFSYVLHSSIFVTSVIGLSQYIKARGWLFL